MIAYHKLFLTPQAQNKLYAVLFFDLDRFKIVNDSLGHKYGDQLLIEVAQRIQGCLRKEDTVARMGGDEFVILLPSLKYQDGVELIALEIINVIAQSYMINAQEIVLEASIGVALYPRNSIDANALLKCANIAMYHAKEQGGNCFKHYLEDSNLEIDRHLQISTQLRYAIERKQLMMYFQPQYDLKTDQIIGAEALIRWHHPELGMVSPGEFIPIAEESNLIMKISDWVAATVFAYCREWQILGLPLVSVAMNLSAKQFNTMTLPDTLSELFKKYKLNPQGFTLELEITEGMLMRHPGQAIEILHQLKAMNFAISIDDFGTGYSSLAYLKRFPIDKLKIDRAFIKDLPLDSDDAAISRAIIVMAHELGLQVVAEGVETQAQLDFLKKHQCDYIQGYLIAKPMAAEDFTTLLKQL
jgi:diguanylate cyclase (GGDEF)-like protein